MPNTRICQQCQTLERKIRDYFNQLAVEEKFWDIPKELIFRTYFRQDCDSCRQISNYLGRFGSKKKYLDIAFHASRTVGWRPFELVKPGCNEAYPCILDYDKDALEHNILLLVDTQQHQNIETFHKNKILASGRILRSVPDFTLAKEWLQRCQALHLHCARDSKTCVSPLRLINCATRKLQLDFQSQPYVALSYVWGSTITQDSRPTLELPKSLPKTVEDAMIVAQILEIPYLWVDRYCISQTDKNEIHHLVRNMDKIYRNAELTIIATAGSDAACGLPGVGGTPRRKGQSVQLGPYTFAPLVTAEEILNSAWNRRGWTFQEGQLSRRRLVFTESQMYFQCQNSSDQESGDLAPHLSNFPQHKTRAFPEPWTRATPWLLYERIVEYYPRQLSFKDDALRAFEGIFTWVGDQNASLTKSPVSHFWGIPVLPWGEDNGIHNFLRGLCYTDQSKMGRLSAKATDCTGFPSWTWAALKASRSNDELGELHFDSRLITDYSVTPKLIRRRIGDADFTPALVSDIQFSQIKGSRVTIADFISQADHYTEYYPWFDITSETSIITGCFNQLHSKRISPVLSQWERDWGLSLATYLDYSRAIEEEALMLIALYEHLLSEDDPYHQGISREVRGLLLEECENSCWRRVGMWRMFLRYPTSDSDSRRKYMDAALARLLNKECFMHYEPWQNRTLRIV